MRAISTPLITIPIQARIAVGVNCPRVTNVASLETIIPAFFSPIKAINIPIPEEMA